MLPSSVLGAWGGIEAPVDGRVIEARFRWNGPGSPATDYDRACDVRAWAAPIAVGEAVGIVFGDEPGQAAWWRGDDGGLLVRWLFAPSEAAVEKALRAGVDADWADAFEWPLAGKAVLIDSSVPGHEAAAEASTLKIPLRAGRWRVETAHWSPDAAISMVVHRFTRLTAAAPRARSARTRSPAKRGTARRGRR